MKNLFELSSSEQMLQQNQSVDTKLSLLSHRSADNDPLPPNQLKDVGLCTAVSAAIREVAVSPAASNKTDLSGRISPGSAPASIHSFIQTSAPTTARRQRSLTATSRQQIVRLTAECVLHRARRRLSTPLLCVLQLSQLRVREVKKCTHQLSSVNLYDENIKRELRNNGEKEG